MKLSVSFFIGVLSSAILSLAAQAQMKIMPVGDSITRGNTEGPSSPTYGNGGWRYHLERYLEADGTNYTSVGPEAGGNGFGGSLAHFGTQLNIPMNQISHWGVGCTGTGEVRDNIAARMATYQPNLLMIMIGTNDRTTTPDWPTVNTRYQTMLYNIYVANPAAKVIIAKIPPSARPSLAAPTTPL